MGLSSIGGDLDGELRENPDKKVGGQALATLACRHPR